MFYHRLLFKLDDSYCEVVYNWYKHLIIIIIIKGSNIIEAVHIFIIDFMTEM